LGRWYPCNNCPLLSEQVTVKYFWDLNFIRITPHQNNINKTSVCSDPHNLSKYCTHKNTKILH